MEKLKAFVVYDPRKASDDINSIMSMVNDVELKLENTKHNDPAMIYAKLPPFVRRFLNYEVNENKMMHRFANRTRSHSKQPCRDVRHVVINEHDMRTDDGLLRRQGLGGEGVRCLQ